MGGGFPGPRWIFRDKAEMPGDERGEFSAEESVVVGDGARIQGPGLEPGGWGAGGLLDAPQTGGLSRKHKKDWLVCT